jgi:DNA-binding beta-propeller fold protein YncE
MRYAMAAVACTIGLVVSIPRVQAGVLYGIESWGQERLITLDRNDATATDIGFFIDTFGPFGLAHDPNSDTLYLTNQVDDRLYTVNQTTGESTPIGNPGDIGANAPHGLAYDPNANILYMSDTETNQLFRVNTANGVGISIGPFGGPFGGVEGLGFDADANILYGLSDLSDEILTINTTTGAAASLALSLPSGTWGGLDYDSELNVLWATNRTDRNLYRIDPVALTFTAIGSTQGSGSSTSVHGLAFKIPEPATGVLLAGFALLGLRRRRRQ